METLKSVETTRNRLSEIGFVFKSLIYLECAWIPTIADFDVKVIVGEGVGYSAQALEIIAVRIRELNELEPSFKTYRSEIPKVFEEALNISDPLEKACFICQISTSLLQEIKVLEENIDTLFDQPTVWVVYSVKSILEHKLREWTDIVEHDRFIDKKIFAGPIDHTLATLETVKPTTIDQPLRPDCLIQSPQNILDKPTNELLKSKDGICRFIHFIYSEIEVSAAEICARNISDFGPVMPLQFTFDMARQVMDEMRHAKMAKKLLYKYGGELGDFTYRNHVWNSYLLGDSLAEKLAIEQIIGEGNGLDTTALSISIFDELGLSDLKTYYEFLQADETIHCAFGNRWISYLVDYDQSKFDDVIDQAIEKIGVSLPGFAPVDIDLRLNAEFSKEFIYRKLLKKPLTESI